MKFKEIVAQIVADNPLGISPPEIQKTIEKEYPNFYSTDTHIRNVKKGHYSDLHHALKAQVYSLVRQCDDFVCDKSVKPFWYF
ncbi:hypothetical protein ACTFQF_16555 [Aliivibrio fischeri]|uniref:hypothetical protein n=1 Tax=Aliivibrio fischeri TaxID=668 RepID=UPI0009C07874|nr:hypothetical protein [Aliivibrio fischeri]MBP3140248.1 hypothetical protein [Aliivibrio fischeri]MBP3154633.1 hypothetical protein [Aliivibrio fischeri]MCE7575639.1 hypothetical protein [Aliivibrio fischeri]